VQALHRPPKAPLGEAALARVLARPLLGRLRLGLGRIPRRDRAGERDRERHEAAQHEQDE
jgi:hypothetical protein